MEQLVALSTRLGNPGADKLYQAARKHGIRVSKDDIKNYLSVKGEKQLFLPVPPSKGKTASESIDYRMQMDLIDMKNSPSKGFKNILVLVDVFSRQAWAKPIKNKEPERGNGACATHKCCHRHHGIRLPSAIGTPRT